MKNRKAAEMNAGSMADIAFLLLIFFLIATTIEVDTGIPRRLPEDRNITPPPVPRRNILLVLINKNNEVSIDGEFINLNDLRVKTKEFITNPDDKDNLPKLIEWEIKPLGTIKSTKNHIVSIQSDRGTNYEMYLAVQNEITAAYNELRNEFAIKNFGKNYNDLDEFIKDAIQKVYPNHISEAEPRDIGPNLADL